MKNQNNIIIFLAFLIILLLIPTVCASDLNNAVDPISLSSADADTTVSMQSDDSDVNEVTNSPLSLAKADNSTVELDSNHVLKATSQFFMKLSRSKVRVQSHWNNIPFIIQGHKVR